MALFLSIFPIVLLIWLMVKKNSVPSYIALPVTAALIYLIQMFYFDSPALALNANVAAGLVATLTPITVIFGAPGIIAPLIECEPSLALELPFKFLFQKREGKTVVSFEDIKSVAARYGASDCPALDAAQRLERELFDAAVK